MSRFFSKDPPDADIVDLRQDVAPLAATIAATSNGSRAKKMVEALVVRKSHADF